MINPHLKEESVKPDFRTRYCAHYHSPPEAFETRLFKTCLHHRGRIFYGLVSLLFSQFFYSDFVFLRNAAMAQDFRDLQMAIQGYKLDCQRDPSFLYDTLKFRVSCRKVMEIYTGLASINRPFPQPQGQSFNLMTDTAG